MKYGMSKSAYLKIIKPIIDFALALMGTILLIPVFFLVFGLLLIAFRGKVIFVQERTGRREKPFVIYKFKTMTDEKDGDGKLLSDADRLTFIGKFMRNTSLDELPQLINVLKGDMSFIGPRPLLPEYLPYYTSRQKRRHLVRPGISGLAQINGRNQTSWEQRLELDVEYVDSISFKLDCKLLLKTVLKVVKSEGVMPEGQVTMSNFSEYIKNKQV